MDLNHFYFNYFGKLAAIAVGIAFIYWLSVHLPLGYFLGIGVAALIGIVLYGHFMTARYKFEIEQSRIESEKEQATIREKMRKRGKAI